MKIVLTSIMILLSSPAMAEVLISIDKTEQKMTVVVDGEPTYDWPVSTGKQGYDTPSGVYTAQSMNEIWYSKQWDNAPMPHSIFYMKDGHAIHGTTEEKNLGKAASHGCVRLSKENAATLFELVKEQGLEKTQVILSGEVVHSVVSEPSYKQRPVQNRPYTKRWRKPAPAPAPRARVPFDLYHGFRGGY